MKIQYKSEGLIILESSLFRTTSTLIYNQDYILLIDPNWLPIEIDFIADLVEKYGKNKVKHLLFTHSDYDHIIGYGKFKTFKTIASQNFIDNSDKASIIKQINDFDDENYIKRDYEIVYPNIELPIALDPQHLQIGNDEYHFYQSKGHNKDGMITFNKSQGILIVGDYLSNIEFPYIYESFKKYKNTLVKLGHIIETEKVNILIPGHGHFTTDKDEMKLRIKESYRYIEDLESHVKNNMPFDFEKLFERYQFPGIMMKFHEANMKVLRKEML